MCRDRLSQDAAGQNEWYNFGVGAPPILVFFSGAWDVHWGYGVLTHGHMSGLLLFGVLATSNMDI